MKCNNCNEEVFDDSLLCPHCGAKLVVNENERPSEINVDKYDVPYETSDNPSQNSTSIELSEDIDTGSVQLFQNDTLKYSHNNEYSSTNHKVWSLNNFKKSLNQITKRFNANRKLSIGIIGGIVAVIVILIFINSSTAEKLKLNFYGMTSNENNLTGYIQNNYKNKNTDELVLNAVNIISSHKFNNSIKYLDKLFYDENNSQFSIRKDVLKSFDKYKIKFSSLKDLCGIYSTDNKLKLLPREDIINAIKLFTPEETESVFLERINSLYNDKNVEGAYNLTKNYTNDQLGALDQIKEIKPDIDVLCSYYFSSSNSEISDKVKEMILKNDMGAIEKESIALINKQYTKPDLVSAKAIADKYLNDFGKSANITNLSNLFSGIASNNSKITNLQSNSSENDLKINDLNNQISDLKKQIDDTNSKTADIKNAINIAQTSYNALNSSIINLRFYVIGVFGDGSNNHEYEIDIPTHDAWGDEILASKHEVLDTVDVVYSTKGWANLQVVKNGTTQVQLNSDNGNFTQTWDLYREISDSDKQNLANYTKTINDGNGEIAQNNKSVSDLNNQINSIANVQIKQLNIEKSSIQNQIKQLQNDVSSLDGKVKQITK